MILTGPQDAIGPVTELEDLRGYGNRPHSLFPWLTDLEVARMMAENWEGFLLWVHKRKSEGRWPPQFSPAPEKNGGTP